MMNYGEITFCTALLVGQMLVLANAQVCIPSTVQCQLSSNGTDPCCHGNKCQPDESGTLRCERQCTEVGEMCQPVARPEDDWCCHGSQCQLSEQLQMFACTPAPTTPPPCQEEGSRCRDSESCCGDLECRDGECQPPRQCVDEGDRCSGLGLPCCSSLSCQDYVCRQCVSEGGSCDVYGVPRCCGQLSCHGDFFTPWLTSCQRQCAGYGVGCGENTRCCSNYCNFFSGTCQ